MIMREHTSMRPTFAFEALVPVANRDVRAVVTVDTAEREARQPVDAAA
jgi:hypothetical protein